MRISADVTSLISTERTMKIEHGEGKDVRHVTFALTLYKKDHFSKDNETFRVINEYWGSLPKQVQGDIYAVFEDIRELFDSVSGNAELRRELNVLVCRLMDFHKTKDVIRWIKASSTLTVPRSIEREYKFDVDKNTTPDKTYIYEDYIGLMSLSVIFRAMIPIWAMFNKPAKDSGGKTSKEFHSFLLLQGSEVYGSEPWDRLLRYVTANAGKDAFTGNHTLELIRKEDFPFHLLSVVCVRKLCLGELYSEDPRQNLAALVYNYLIDRPGPQGNDYSAQVREKRLRREGGGETTEHSGSTLEIYKARATITTGRIAEMEYGLRDPVNLAQQLCPEVDPAIIEKDVLKALETSAVMADKGIQIPQRLIAQWVTQTVFPPQAALYIEAQVLVKLCAITEVVLMHKGFEYLALLSTCTAMTDEDSIRMTPMGSKTQVGEELSAKLTQYFPHRRISTKKGSNGTELCFVSEDIKKMAIEFSRYTWRATANEALVRRVLNTHVRRVPMLGQLRSDITAMLVKLEEDYSKKN